MTIVPSNAEDTCLKNQTYQHEVAPWREKQAYDGRGRVHDEERPPTAVGRYENTFPEGGTQAWLVVFGSFCALFSVFGLINTAAVFESWFSTHQLAQYSPSQIGWIFSLYLFFVFFVGIQVGPVFDRYGPRYPVAIGSVLIVSSLMLLGFCEGG